MTAIDLNLDWSSDFQVSPWKLIPWRQACTDLGIASDTLARLVAEHNIQVVLITKKKRSLLARDLVRLVAERRKDPASYAVNKMAGHA
jgi:hypothetical protein